MEERISKIKDRNKEMMQLEEDRDFSVKKNDRTLPKLSPSARATQE